MTEVRVKTATYAPVLVDTPSLVVEQREEIVRVTVYGKVSTVLLPSPSMALHVSPPQALRVDLYEKETVAILHEGVMGAPGPAGETGPQGPPGAAGAYFVWDQSVASAVWHIVHPLSKRPSVMVVDSSHRVVLGRIEYLSDSAIDITFHGAFTGSAYLN